LFWSIFKIETLFEGEEEYSGAAQQRHYGPVDIHERFVGATSRQFHDKRDRSFAEIRKRFDIRHQA